MQLLSAQLPRIFLNRSCPATSHTATKNTLLAMVPTAWWYAPTFALNRVKWFSCAASRTGLRSLSCTDKASKKRKQRNQTKPVETKSPQVNQAGKQEGNFNKNVKTVQRCQTSIKLPTTGTNGTTKLLQPNTIL